MNLTFESTILTTMVFVIQKKITKKLRWTFQWCKWSLYSIRYLRRLTIHFLFINKHNYSFTAFRLSFVFQSLKFRVNFLLNSDIFLIIQGGGNKWISTSSFVFVRTIWLLLEKCFWGTLVFHKRITSLPYLRF